MALYDPNEFPETKVGADFTLADVLAWARTKPADEVYSYYDAGSCAATQFGRETGRDYLVRVGDLRQRYFDLDEIVQGTRGCPQDWTFGKLVQRLESALA